MSTESPKFICPEIKNNEKSSLSFSVIMPTFNQCAFIRRAVASLIGQTYPLWELIIVNDGSTDATREFLGDYLSDPRIKYIENIGNQGIGYSLNRGIDAACNDIIAYLPSDDIFYENHLCALANALLKDPDAALAYSGVKFDSSASPGLLDYKTCKGAIPGYCTQLVQVAHRRTADRWTERSECVSEDYFYLFWRKLTDKGVFVPTSEVTCEWTCHQQQHHKICGEQYGGGLNKYRSFYGVKTPLVFRSSCYKIFDERENYALYRGDTKPVENSLKILLVGELAYNPQRIYALEKAGHRLFGLWGEPRFGYSTVGPLPFGHVEDVPYSCWKERVAEIKPDIIYALLSTSAIEIAHEVLENNTGIPFVWHFKEGPHEAIKEGLWDKLVALYSRADGCIFLNEEEKLWISQFIPPKEDDECLLLDGDMPPADIFTDRFSPKLSMTDGEIHTLVAGRMVGISPADYAVLAKNGIHIHLYNENRMPPEVIRPFHAVDSFHIHEHPHCPPSRWTEEFSRYDAGWLHCVESTNGGSPLKMTWADMNLPARISTYLVAGIPMIQRRNSGHIFAQRGYVKEYGIDLPYDSIDELVGLLRNSTMLASATSRVLKIRNNFSFDANVGRLIQFFYTIIARCRS